jgi:tetraacyldisaccharide-1-P 4'-kinase
VRADAVVASLRFATDDLVPLARWMGAASADGGDAVVAVATDAPDVTRGVLAVTAIARPDALPPALAGLLGEPVELMAFPDHHDFTARDATVARARAGDRPIVVTEKDAVKLADHAEALGETFVIRQRLVWDWGEDDLRDLVAGGAS